MKGCELRNQVDQAVQRHDSHSERLRAQSTRNAIPAGAIIVPLPVPQGRPQRLVYSLAPSLVMARYTAGHGGLVEAIEAKVCLPTPPAFQAAFSPTNPEFATGLAKCHPSDARPCDGLRRFGSMPAV